MKTDRERVDALTAQLFASFLRDHYRLGLGLHTEADFFKKARAIAWRIVREPAVDPSGSESLENTIRKREETLAALEGAGKPLPLAPEPPPHPDTLKFYQRRAEEKSLEVYRLRGELLKAQGVRDGFQREIETASLKARVCALREAQALCQSVADVYNKDEELNSRTTTAAYLSKTLGGLADNVERAAEREGRGP